MITDIKRPVKSEKGGLEKAKLDKNKKVKAEKAFEKKENNFWKNFLFFILFTIFVGAIFYFYKNNQLNFIADIFKQDKKTVINLDGNSDKSGAENLDGDDSEISSDPDDDSDDDEGVQLSEEEKAELINNLNNKEDSDEIGDTEKVESTISSVEAQKIIEKKSNEAILALKNKDFKKVASFMSADEKLVFSPYCYVKSEYLSFSKSEVENFSTDLKRYNWGTYNGVSPTKIDMTFSDYYNEFIYDQDFAQAEKISYNQILGKGNMINNIQSFFPNSIIVEYHFSGFEEELEGMDWKSLRLVFVKVGDEWFLKAIVHDTWTI